jgi:hypothetical protein
VSLVQADSAWLILLFTNSYCFSYRYAAAPADRRWSHNRPCTWGVSHEGSIVGATINLAYVGVKFVGGQHPQRYRFGHH